MKKRTWADRLLSNGDESHTVAQHIFELGRGCIGLGGLLAWPGSLIWNKLLYAWPIGGAMYVILAAISFTIEYIQEKCRS